MINLNIIKHRRFWLALAGSLFVLALIFLFSWGLKFGLDFTGGNLMELKISQENLEANELQEYLKDLELGGLLIQATEDSFILRFQEGEGDSRQLILSTLEESFGGELEIEELRFESIGSSIGKELRSRSFWLILFVLIIIIIYIGAAFKKVSKPVSSWKYGLIAIIALFFDVMITIGAFALFGHLYGMEINTTFVVAILTVVGYSVNDTIVIFDRVRENLPRTSSSFSETVNASINQTFVRSINTVISTLLALFAIFFFGGESIRDFVLALIIGIFSGAFSSIFLASPLLVEWEARQKS